MVGLSRLPTNQVSRREYEAARRRLAGSLERHNKTAVLSQQPVAKPSNRFVTDPTYAEQWIERNFWIPELQGAIELYPHQRAVIREAHRRDERGHFVYSIVLYSDIKKSAKSTIAAAVALYRAHMTSWGTIKIVANDLKQADSRVAYYLRRAVTLNPEMAKVVKQKSYVTTLPNYTQIEAIPIDPGGEAGGNDDMIIFSELWAAKNKAIRQMWTEMTLSPTKFGHSQRWIETYAGYTGESPILEQLYRQGVKEGEQLDLSYTDENGRFYDLSDLEVFANGNLLCLWNTRPRLPWQTDEYYASEEFTLEHSEFLRVHRNQFVTSSNKFIPIEWWDACQTADTLRADEGVITLAMDAGVSGDNFALVGTINDEDEGTADLVYGHAWEPPKGGTIDFRGLEGSITPERELIRLCFRYNVAEVRYDPYQLHDMATRLSHGVWVDDYGGIVEDPRYRVKKITPVMVPFGQGKPRLEADKQLQQMIKERKLRHNGHSEVREHVDNANANINQEDNKLRLVKREDGAKIDLAVALSMSSYRELLKDEVQIGVY